MLLHGTHLFISVGNVYIGEYGNHRIRKITASTSVISTIAGTGTAGYSGNDGQATAANIQYPTGVNLDSSLNVYFGDQLGYNVIRKVTVSTGVISTVAGTGSTSGGYNGDNIQATAATLYYPHDVVFDSYNNLYISDRNNYRIRKVDALTGVITTVVGSGIVSSTGDGSLATSATVTGPYFSRFDSAGNYYITECDGNRIRKVITVTFDIRVAVSSSTVTLYKDCDYKGNSASYGVGTYFFDSTIQNDVLSSVKVPYNFKVTLYQDAENGVCYGNILALGQGDYSCLTAYNYDNVASCWVVEDFTTTAAPSTTPR